MGPAALAESSADIGAGACSALTWLAPRRSLVIGCRFRYAGRNHFPPAARHTTRIMANSSPRETPSIQSLGRGLSILEAVAEAREPVPLKLLTALLGIDRSSVFRLANTLKRRRYLASPHGRKDYILGPSAWRLSRRHYGHNTLAGFCREELQVLSSKTEDTVHAAVREGVSAVFIDHCTPKRRVVMDSA